MTSQRLQTIEDGLGERLRRLERWLRTSPRQVSAIVVALIVLTALWQDGVEQHLWLVVTYAFPVALAGYGLGLRGGVVVALLATALLYDHAVGTLGTRDTAFVLVTRLVGSLAVASLCALASATARAREEYIVSKTRLAQLQEDLVAAFAHDIRSPLNAILGYASMLQEDSGARGASPELFAGLERIRTNALHVDEMVEEMLTLDQAHGAPHNVVTTFTTEELVALLRAEFEPIARVQGQDVAWRTEPGTPPFTTDQRKLVSVVRNLVGNALKYAAGGPVDVRIRFDPKVASHRIEVGDSGPGIPRHSLPHLFDRFYRVGGERDRDGFGLGLFIVKRMMEMLGGEVSVESEVGRGSRFFLVVPRLLEEAPEAARKAAGA